MLRGSHERRAWLDSLPERIDQQCRAWNLSLDGDPWHGSNALVLPVRRGGEQFALRLTAPDESFPAEVAALRFWAGKPSDRCPHRNSAQCLERRCCSSSRFAAPAVLAHQAGGIFEPVGTAAIEERAAGRGGPGLGSGGVRPSGRRRRG